MKALNSAKEYAFTLNNIKIHAVEAESRPKLAKTALELHVISIISVRC